jgi:hypothetical protein
MIDQKMIEIPPVTIPEEKLSEMFESLIDEAEGTDFSSKESLES